MIIELLISIHYLVMILEPLFILNLELYDTRTISIDSRINNVLLLFTVLVLVINHYLFI